MTGKEGMSFELKSQWSISLFCQTSNVLLVEVAVCLGPDSGPHMPRVLGVGMGAGGRCYSLLCSPC